MDRKIYDAMMSIEDNIDHPPHMLTSAMPHKIVDALKAAGFVIIPSAENRQLREALAALYEWYDRDGSVGAASVVFEAHRAVLGQS